MFEVCCCWRTQGLICRTPEMNTKSIRGDFRGALDPNNVAVEPIPVKMADQEIFKSKLF